MKRIGKCLRCGKCCKLLTLTESDINLKRLVEKLGIKKEIKCSHLGYVKGVFVCGIYDRRPDFCRRYPESPEDLIPGCGFRFVVSEVRP